MPYPNVSRAAFAANEPPASLEAPENYNAVETDHPGILHLRLANPDSIIKLLAEHGLFFEVDWKINNGPWKFTKDWEGFTVEGVYDYYGDKDSILGDVTTIGRDEDDTLTIVAPNNPLGIESFDL